MHSQLLFYYGKPPPAHHPVMKAIDDELKRQYKLSAPFFNKVMAGDVVAWQKDIRGTLQLYRYPPTV